MEEKKPRRPSGVQVYSSTRGLWARRDEERSYENRGRKSENETEGEKGVYICMPSRSLTAVRTDNSRVLFLRSSTGGIGIQHGKWKRISPVPPPPYTDGDARDEFLVHFYFFLPQFAGAFLPP